MLLPMISSFDKFESIQMIIPVVNIGTIKPPGTVNVVSADAFFVKSNSFPKMPCKTN